MTRHLRHHRLAGMVAAGTAIIMAVAGCSTTSSNADQTSVPVGADKETYVQALAEMDPVQLKVQLLTPSNSAHAKATEAYTKAVQEWSGDKITFKIHYSGAVTSTGVEAAVADGLIDIAPLYPSMDPDNFPVQAFASNYAFMNDGSAIAGTLQSAGAWVEAGFDEQVVTELQDEGLQPLLPMMVPTSNHLYCGDKKVTSLDDARGAQLRASTPGNVAEVKAIGAVAVNLPTLEIFEGIQRGTVDCVVTTWAVPMTFGLAEVSKNWMVDPDVHFTGSSETLAIGKATWDRLPLAAQQLLWDQLGVYLTSYIENNVFATIDGALSQADQHGVKISEYGEDLTKALQDHHDQLLTQADKNSPKGFDGQTFVDSAQKSHEAWKKTITDLGYADDVEWADFHSWSQDNKIDVKPFVNRLVEDVLSKHRPTGDKN